MRDNQNYLSKNMLYNINVTIVLQYIGSYALFLKRKLLTISRIPLRNSQVNLEETQAVALREV
jgi:hypothetical protein